VSVLVTAVSVTEVLGQQPRPRASAVLVKSDQADVTSFLTEEVVTPGSPFSLVLEISPHPGMHMYAPGAAGYKIVAFALESNPVLVSQPLEYPASEIYEFRPLNERVPVYQTPFRLAQRFAISTAPEHRAALAGRTAVTIRGTFTYQACDDRVCFTPRSVPIAHDVTLRAPAPRRTTAPK
jgi:DsbC/DsbD-like thiol-disulfide interchange protein